MPSDVLARARAALARKPSVLTRAEAAMKAASTAASGAGLDSGGVNDLLARLRESKEAKPAGAGAADDAREQVRDTRQGDEAFARRGVLRCAARNVAALRAAAFVGAYGMHVHPR